MFNALVSQISLYIMPVVVLLVSQPVFAQINTNFRSWSIGEIAIAIIIIIAAVVAIVYVALKKFGITIPPWVVQVCWIVVVAGVCIPAIRLILGM